MFHRFFTRVRWVSEWRWLPSLRIDQGNACRLLDPRTPKIIEVEKGMPKGKPGKATVAINHFKKLYVVEVLAKQQGMAEEALHIRQDISKVQSVAGEVRSTSAAKNTLRQSYPI
ncbi:hypothetical protein V6259_09645 [Marinomonas sp. TI.3.20]|uniref:hypothetical protein n=1 Tax=Marinomonas sp. TI.3.20 TaxID=3121296 RepID=UPI00311E8BF0